MINKLQTVISLTHSSKRLVSSLLDNPSSIRNMHEVLNEIIINCEHSVTIIKDQITHIQTKELLNKDDVNEN